MLCYDIGSLNKYFFIEMKNDVFIGDGWYKFVYVINGEIFGFNIVVFED